MGLLNGRESGDRGRKAVTAAGLPGKTDTTLATPKKWRPDAGRDGDRTNDQRMCRKTPLNTATDGHRHLPNEASAVPMDSQRCKLEIESYLNSSCHSSYLWTSRSAINRKNSVQVNIRVWLAIFVQTQHRVLYHSNLPTVRSYRRDFMGVVLVEP
ncbi:hypothetical protein KIN20_034714 [Parelaphostrongylus tenuis]|uniref:Uncharacterized protein n=1 Tax=Parelaphostrongylus tenuis TaxID=148309 RepID=A0AAD5RA37_PARTN|nr:hypothetical protein KIN20_034714 [Parelaphostrongylus tenuis]